MKAVKNHAEIAGTRAAHKRDGAALARFLAWLEREAPKGKLTEIDAVKALESFRRDTGVLKDVSFPTIAGSGPNGAIVHYRVTQATNRRIGMNELFLVDSGAQYEDGTTDVTRTVAIGKPTAEMRDRFTRVLKGHIAIATAVFPENTSGAQLDPLARTALWQAGLDFDHGTGHGVGSYLSVHEGPASISKLGTVALRRGMILSNEPGYYKTAAYGIRTENLVLVIAAPRAGGRREAAQYVRDADAGADRPGADRGARCSPRRSGTGSTAITRACARCSAPLVDAPTRKWLDSRDAATAAAQEIKLQPLVLGEHRDAELLGLGELGAGARPGHDVIGLLRHRARRLGAEPLGRGLGLLARHLLQRCR